jgi:phosphodiesterase/alkaline phosphatase D-like protein
MFMPLANLRSSLTDAGRNSIQDNLGNHEPAKVLTVGDTIYEELTHDSAIQALAKGKIRALDYTLQ